MTYPLVDIATLVRRGLGALALCLLLAGSAQPAFAQFEVPTRAGDLGTRWPIDDAQPGAHIPPLAERNKYPLEFGYWLQDMLARAEGAWKAGEWARSARYYEVLREAVPDTGTSYSRLCGAYYHLNDADRALPNCVQAMSKARNVVYDHLRFLDLMLQKPSLRPEQIQAIEASLTHLREHAKAHPQALPGDEVAEATFERADDMTPEERKADPGKWRELKAQEMLRSAAGEPEPKVSGDGMHLPTQVEIFSCRLGVRTKDAERLSECTSRLAAYRFEPQLLVPFRWAEAIARDDHEAVEQVLAAAVQAGMPPAVIEKMRAEQGRLYAEGEGDSAAGSLAQLPPWLPIAGAVLLLVGIGAVVVVRRSRHGGASAT